MIDELHVTNVALIREAQIEPAAGLTVLTGETGAGKTALLSAVKLLCGERADATAVREGSDGLAIEARVFLGPDDTEGVVVSRSVEAGGRGRVRVDGRMASVGELARQVGSTIDLCGQHEHQRLLDTSTHVGLIDAWAGAQAEQVLASYREALQAARAAAKELARVQELSRQSHERVEEAEFVLRRIDELGPSREEYQELEETLPRAEYAEALLRAAVEARTLLSDESGASDALSEAISLLRDAAAHDATLDRYADSLESVLIDVEDVASELRGYRDSVELDPEELGQMQERMAAYQGLLRSYGPSLEELLERREQAAEVVAAVRNGGERLTCAQRACDEAEAALAKRADELDALRAAAVPGLLDAARKEMAKLEMGTASLEFSQERQKREQWGSSGPSKVELLYRPAAGLSARPLRRIASGGEISRVMLAIKVALGAQDVAETLVFDEVDAGVGGATAVALAQVLAQLAKTHQVIVVTHLAQLAVVAERHYLVEKSTGDVPETSLHQLNYEERTKEIARMLSGNTSEASLAHAAELLQAAEHKG